MSSVALVVMELGSEWPGWFGGSADVVAFSQGGEKLLGRTQEALGALRSGRQDIAVAVFACNEDPEADPGGYRAQIAEALLSAVRDAPSGRLILTASDRAPARVRFELLSLAGALTESLRGTTATVSLRFIESAPDEPSRTRPFVRALAGSSGAVTSDLQ